MNNAPQTPIFSSHGHDHEACIQQALARADAVCAERGLRLTEIRRRVLELIWANHRPAKAYDLLNTINTERGNAAPPTIYRALDFLLEAGLVHRIESLNAFVGCDGHHQNSHPKFLICRVCERAAEIASPEIDDTIAREAHQTGFTIDRETIEVIGTCAACGPVAS